MKKMHLLAITLECVGIAVTGGGIGVELVKNADVWMQVITFGSVLVAIGGVIWGKFIKSERH